MSAACCWDCAAPRERMSLMILCPDCGNKRCPRGTSHANACTRSNDPGQPGSRYGGLDGLDAGPSHRALHGHVDFESPTTRALAALDREPAPEPAGEG